MASFTEQATLKLKDESTPQINRSTAHLFIMREFHYEWIARELGTWRGDGAAK